MATRRFSNCVQAITKVRNKILSDQLNGNHKLTITAVYAPTKGDGQEANTQFYDELSAFCEHVPRHNVTIGIKRIDRATSAGVYRRIKAQPLLSQS